MQMQPSTRQRRPVITPFLRGVQKGTLRTQVDVARGHLVKGRAFRSKAAADALHAHAPQDPDLLALRADCARATGHYHDAITLYDRALTQVDDAALWAGKGRALHALQRHMHAVACLQRAIALAPNQAAYRCDAANSLIHAGHPQDAYVQLMRADSDSRTPLLRALALREMGQIKPALEQAFSATTRAPSGPALRLSRDLAKTHVEQAAWRRVSAAVLNTRELDGDVLAAAVCDQRPYLTKSLLNRIHETLSAGSISGTDAMLHHVLFRHYDFIDERSTAQHHLRQFHSLKAPVVSNDDTRLLRRLKRLRYTPLPQSKSSILPVFVTGLPGSGVNHAVAVLEAGTKPAPARPLHLVPAVMKRFMRHVCRSGSRNISRDDLMGLQSELRAGLAQAAQGVDVVIDSSFMNFRWSGLICAALPEARVVHMKSNKMQIGWAMYSRALADQGLPFRHRLTTLAQYQMHSRRLMQHYETLFPKAITSLSGNALTDDCARDLLEACQLPWCAQNDLPTPPVPADWQRYAQLLKPLRNMKRENPVITPM